jgi:FAD/FMN-containing dehydrogenase
MSSHNHGLTLDMMIGATVVLANSSVVHCSENENPDLFWALRGAGSSFGVVAQYEFRTFEAPKEVTYFNAPVAWTAENGVKAFQALQEYAENAMPAELNMRVFLSSFDVFLEGVYHGSLEGLQATLEPLLKEVYGRIDYNKTATAGWLDSLINFTYGQNLSQSHPYIMVSCSYELSRLSQLAVLRLTGMAARQLLRIKPHHERLD